MAHQIDADDMTQCDRLQRECENLAVSTMLKVQFMAAGNETEFQYALCLVIHKLQSHLGLSLGAQMAKEEFMEGILASEVTPK